jgi:glycosyltransferase involved in cell wall biosynthesis
MVENGRPDLVHVQVPMKAGIIALWLKKKYQLPYVITEHWGIYNDVEVENYSRKSRIFKFFTKKIISGTSGLISPSQYLVNDMKRYFKIKNDVVIPNTVDTSLFFYRQNKNQIFRFIHVSNMVPLKNITGIIASFKAFLEEGGEAELILVGDTEPSTRKIAEDLHIPGNRIFFKGEVSYQQVAKEMQSSDCFILFSNIENSPCVIGEALCCGIPVIASDVGGVAELVDITNSILTGAQQTSALLKAMHSMVRDAVKYDKKKIAESATAKFSYPVIGKSFDELYSSLTG